jgi:hypothetical protein
MEDATITYRQDRRTGQKKQTKSDVMTMANRPEGLLQATSVDFSPTKTTVNTENKRPSKAHKLPSIAQRFAREP